MVKTKRKHLAALGAKKKQRPPAPHDVKSEPIVKEHGHPHQPESPAEPSWTSPSGHHLQKHPGKHEGEGDPPAEVSHPSAPPPTDEHKRERHDAPVPPSSPYLQPQADDSDTDSWVDVRKQRIIIIIPPLPPAKPRFPKTSQHMVKLRKDGFRCSQGKNTAKRREEKSKHKASSIGAYGKSRRQNAIGTLETENNAERSSSRRTRESTGAPLISSMDILLASALGTDHSIRTPWKQKTRQHAPKFEEASLDTADSSVQPRRPLLKARKGSKAAVRSNQLAQEHIKKRKTSIRKSVCPNMPRKHRKLLQATSVADDVLGHLLSPDVGDAKANGFNHCGGDFPVSSNQAVKILTLKKHLDNAGGLRSWLCSVGLGQFKEAFEKRMWSERDLLQLQMDDLKRMGKFAVGPRRKLIWAINHLSHQLV